MDEIVLVYGHESSNGGSSCRLKGLEGLGQHKIGLCADNEI